MARSDVRLRSGAGEHALGALLGERVAQREVLQSAPANDNARPGPFLQCEVAADSAYIFPSLELRRTTFSGAVAGVGGDYDVDLYKVVPYLVAGGSPLARLAYEGASEPQMPTGTGDDQVSASTSQLHVFFDLGDHLGSNSVVLDKATGELVERTTYEGYGTTESDYRTARWGNFRNDYKFTGKEEDVEVGLHYFGKRYLNTHLGRWISPDPLAIHAPGEADLNLYAYVSGSVLKNVDPLGLEEKAASTPAAAGPGPDLQKTLDGVIGQMDRIGASADVLKDLQKRVTDGSVQLRSAPEVAKVCGEGAGACSEGAKSSETGKGVVIMSDKDWATLAEVAEHGFDLKDKEHRIGEINAVGLLAHEASHVWADDNPVGQVALETARNRWRAATGLGLSEIQMGVGPKAGKPRGLRLDLWPELWHMKR